MSAHNNDIFCHTHGLRHNSDFGCTVCIAEKHIEAMDKANQAVVVREREKRQRLREKTASIRKKNMGITYETTVEWILILFLLLILLIIPGVLTYLFWSYCFG